MSSRTKLIVGTIVVAAVAAAGAAFAAVRLAESAAPPTVHVSEQAPFGRGIAGFGLGGGRLGGRGFGGGLGPGPNGGFRGGSGFFHAGASSAAVAAYLGLSSSQLQADLQQGQTLAQVAKAQGKSVDGLATLMIGDLKKRLDNAVANGFLTQVQASQLESTFEQQVKNMINGVRPHFGFGGGPQLGGTA